MARPAEFAAGGAVTSLLLEIVSSLARDDDPGLALRRVLAGTAAAGVVGVLEAGLRRSNRLAESGIGPRAIVAGLSFLFGAAGWFGTGGSGNTVPTLLLLELGIALAALCLGRLAGSPLPAFGLFLYSTIAGVATWGAISSVPALGELSAEQVVVVGTAGSLIALGFLIQEYSGSRGWYIVLVAGMILAAVALVLGFDRAMSDLRADDGSMPGYPLASAWFLLAAFFAFAVGFGLLAWRVLTWGWYVFGCAAGAAWLLMLGSSSDENRLRIGLILLIVAVVAGASTTFSKATFRLIALSGMIAIVALAVIEGIAVGDRGEDGDADTARQELAALQIETVSIYNCMLGLRVDRAPFEVQSRETTTEPADGVTRIETAIPTRRVSSCAERAEVARRRVESVPDDAAPELKQLSTLSEDLLRNVCETTRPAPPPEADADDVTDAPQPVMGELEAARQCVPDGENPEAVTTALEVRPQLGLLSALERQVDLRRLQRALIVRELSIVGGPETAPRVAAQAEAAATRLGEAETRLQSERNEKNGLRELFIDGADHAAAELLPGESDDIKLGPFGWLAIAFVAVMAYRRAEIANNRRTSAPIVIEEPLGPSQLKSEDNKHLQAVMEAELSRSGIDEPAALPGSDLVAEVVELIQQDSFQGSGSVAAALQVLKNIGFPTGGITVRPVIDEVDGWTTVTVWVQTTRTGTPIYTESFTDRSPVSAAKLAASYVARAALNYGRNVPRWAQWHSEDGTGFRLFQEATAASRSEPTLDVEAVKSSLMTALAASPATSQLRVELGHLEDLAERPANSLRFHLEARVEHPRLLIAGYRVATSASMLSAQLDRHWFGGGDNEENRRGITTLLLDGGLLRQASRTGIWRRYGPKVGIDELAEQLLHPRRAAGDLTVRRALLCVSWSELQRIGYRLSVPTILAMSTFQSERRYWMRFLRNPNHRRQTSEQFETARLIVELRLLLSAIDPPSDPLSSHQDEIDDAMMLRNRVEAIVREPKAGSHALYNAACFWSLLSEHLDPPVVGAPTQEEARHRAVQLLHRSRRSGRGTYPSWLWIQADPDLKPLEGDDEYDEFRAWLRNGHDHLKQIHARSVGQPALEETNR